MLFSNFTTPQRGFDFAPAAPWNSNRWYRNVRCSLTLGLIFRGFCHIPNACMPQVWCHTRRANDVPHLHCTFLIDISRMHLHSKISKDQNTCCICTPYQIRAARQRFIGSITISSIGSWILKVPFRIFTAETTDALESTCPGEVKPKYCVVTEYVIAGCCERIVF